jgi:hypothetical protein
MKPRLNIIRRALTVASLLFVVPVFAETFTEGKQVPPTTEKLKPADFVWERSQLHRTRHGCGHSC